MKAPPALGFLLALVFSTAAMAERPAAVPLHETPQPLPEISFSDESDNHLTLDRWNGKVILLNVWATWCGPCRLEMPTLDRLQAALGSDRFVVIALSIDRAGAGVVRKFFDEIGIRHLDIFIDETMKAARELRILGLPGTLLIGPNGKELGRLIGPAEWDTPEMITFFRGVIAEQAEKEQTE
ncbi:MAG: TlpA-like protein disulfide reductase [Rhodospirillaceae bacterium]|jgi:thiol-disulfide isomerase/thioredoxin|uniref:TlpA family protein disulfide reductase n=1 Tax=Hyphomonas sp. UBA3201 TaxID=1946623 RepID=UPI000C3BF95E|nr:TlpA disulfide reductase family protein [Hyphomonas sp. UBA3201]MAL73571.1 TlpA-like protein disulfide reductase [Rhodospirillaceae bacterium]MAX61825.1 TlpA-like protein disulfide reductase [Rhodospirillaceae bacterium]|tara:strand:+ start:16019 stop:16564 length:546 start_codon:yes stop_codon:yes gene_type:complete